MGGQKIVVVALIRGGNAISDPPFAARWPRRSEYRGVMSILAGPGDSNLIVPGSLGPPPATTLFLNVF